MDGDMQRRSGREGGRPDERDGGGQGPGAGSPGSSSPPARGKRLTLDTAVRRRRADRAFSIRLATVLRQNERALERLKR